MNLSGSRWQIVVLKDEKLNEVDFLNGRKNSKAFLMLPKFSKIISFISSTIYFFQSNPLKANIQSYSVRNPFL